MDIKNKTFQDFDPMGFTKITMDAYRDGTLQGQLKALNDLKNTIEYRIKEVQEIYDKTEAGKVLKRANEAAFKAGATTDNLPPWEQKDGQS